MVITVVTPWHEHRELADDYWAAMRAGSPDHVLVVDNGSVPPLVDLPGWPRSDGAWTWTERLSGNEGFARACNLGLERVESLWPETDAVLWINNDVVAASAGWIEPLRAALTEKALVGAELREDPSSSVDGAAIPYLEGWCVGGLRRDLLALGGFDEGLLEPAYYSDADLSFRAVAAGMSLRPVRVGLHHKRNVTAGSGFDEGVRRATEANYTRYADRVRRELRRRARELASQVTVVLPFLVGEDEAMLAEAIASVPEGVPHLVARNHGDYASALNDALRQAETEFVQFLGHDDRLGRHALELLVAADADVAYPTRLRFDERWSFLGTFPAPPFAPDRLLQSNFVPGVSLVRRRAALEVGGFRDLGHGTHEDWDLWIRMHRAGFTFRPVPQAAVHVRERPASRSVTAYRKHPDLPARLRRAMRSPTDAGAQTIVQLTTYDAGGGAWKLHRALVETTPHRSLLFRRDDNVIAYPTQHALSDRAELAAALAEADVLHVHIESAWLAQLPREPRKVIHHRGSQYRAHAALYDALDRRAGALRLASNLELAAWAPDLSYLPVPVCFEEWHALARGRERGGVFRVAHSPALPRRRAEKGTSEVVRAVDELRSEGVPIELVLIEGRPWEEALRRRAECDATFDSFWLGMQSSGAEAACMRQPVVAGDAHVARQYERRYGYVPYTYADERSVRDVLRRLATDEDFYRGEQQRVERHVRAHHDLGPVARQYLQLLDGRHAPAAHGS
jgi:GT2 family glycosyltransferase